MRESRLIAVSRFGLLHTFARISNDVCDEVDVESFGDLIDDTPHMSGPSSFVLAEDGEDCTDYLTGPAPDSCPDLPGRSFIRRGLGCNDYDLALTGVGVLGRSRPHFQLYELCIGHLLCAKR